METNQPLIAVAGANDIEPLLGKLFPELSRLYSEDFKVLPSTDTLLEAVGVRYGSPVDGETFWTLEGSCVAFEQKFRAYPKLLGSTPVDRSAYSRLSGLSMDAYFDRQIPAFVRECTVFVFDASPIPSDPFRLNLYRDMMHDLFDRDDLTRFLVVSGSLEEKVRVILDFARVRKR